MIHKTIAIAIGVALVVGAFMSMSIPIHQVSAQVGGPPTSFPGADHYDHAKTPCGFRTPADSHPAFC